jgi:hypothetical protein
VCPLPSPVWIREPTADIGEILHDLYDRVGYDLRLDYQGNPDPPLASADAAWAEQLLRRAGLQ